MRSVCVGFLWWLLFDKRMPLFAINSQFVFCLVEINGQWRVVSSALQIRELVWSTIYAYLSLSNLLSH